MMKSTDFVWSEIDDPDNQHGVLDGAEWKYIPNRMRCIDLVATYKQKFGDALDQPVAISYLHTIMTLRPIVSKQAAVIAMTTARWLQSMAGKDLSEEPTS